MIFKTFDSDNGFLSKIGVFNKSFAEIGKAFRNAFNLSINGIFDDTLNDQGFFKNLKSNLTTQVNEVSDLYSKLFVTKNDIEPFKITDFSVYEKDAQSILDKLLITKDNVESGAISWQDYFGELEEGEKWQAKFVQENDLTKISLEDVDAAQKSAKESAIAYNAELQQMTIGAKAASIGMKALSLAGNMIVAALVAKAIEWAYTAIDNWIHYAENAEKAAKEFSESVNELNKKHSDNTATIKGLNDEYKTLSEGVNNLGQNVNLTEDEFSRYHEITNQVADMMPDLVQGWDEEGNAILRVKGKLADLNEEYRNQKILDAQELYEKNQDKFDEIADNLEIKLKASGTFDYDPTLSEGFIDKQVLFGNQAGSTQKVNSQLKKIYDGSMSFEQYKKYIKDLVGKQNYSDNDAAFGIADAAIQKDLGKSVIETESDFAQYQRKAKELYDKSLKSVSEASSVIENQMKLHAQTLPEYYYGNESLISSFINGLNGDVLYSNNLNDEETMKDFVGNLVSDINSDEDVQSALNSLFSIDLDKTDLAPDALQDKIDNNVKEVFSRLKLEYNDEDILDFEKNLGFDKLSETLNKYNDAIDRFKYSKVNKSNGSKVIENFFKEEGINTSEEIDEFNQITSGILDADEAIQRYKKHKKEVTPSRNEIFFTQGWKDLDSTDDDKLKNLKSDLTTLAESGKLTKDAFYKTDGAKTWLQNVGIDADTAVRKINSLVDSSKQLASLKSGISQLQTALAEKKENKVVGADTLGSMEAEFGKLDSWKKYKETLGSTTSDINACREAQNKLATEYINSNNFLSQLVDTNGKVDESTKQYYIDQLKELGVKNAETVVNQQIKKQKMDLFITEAENNEGIENNIKNLIKEGKQLGYTKSQIQAYILKKALASKNSLKTSDSIKNLVALAKQCGVTSKAIDNLSQILIYESQLKDLVLNNDDNLDHNAYQSRVQDLEQSIERQKSKLKKTIKAKISDDDVDIGDLGDAGGGVDLKDGKGSSSKDKDKDKSKNKSSKQEFDWIERRVTVLNNKISLLNAKKDNLFTVSKKNNNLKKQIKEMTKLLGTYSTAYTKYLQKANSVKLDSKLKSKVRNGAINGSYSQLVQSYGEKIANRIQKYMDYYDKAKSSKESWETVQKQIHDAQVERLQNLADKYNDSAELNSARASKSNYSARTQNKYLTKQQKDLEKNYAYQIKIAKANGKINEAKKLQIELDQKLLELEKAKFDNIQNKYTSKLDNNTYQSNYVGNQVDIIEAKGMVASDSYYNKQISISKKRKTLLNQEHDALKKQLSTIERGTTEYYDALAALRDINLQQQENTKQEIEWNKAKAENNRKKYEAGQNRAGRRITENETLLSFIEHEDSTDSDTGQWTKAGKSRLWAYGYDLGVAQSKKTDSGKRLNELQKMLASGNYGEYLTKANLEEEIDKVISEDQANAKDVYTQRKNLADLVKDHYNQISNYLSDLISKAEESLDNQKDLYDYQKSLQEKTNNIDTIRKQLIALDGDSSEEAMAKKQQLKASLNESNEDLNSAIYDKYISDQKNILQKLQEDFKDFLEKYFKDFDALWKEGLTLTKGENGNYLLQKAKSEGNYTSSKETNTNTSNNKNQTSDQQGNKDGTGDIKTGKNLLTNTTTPTPPPDTKDPKLTKGNVNAWLGKKNALHKSGYDHLSFPTRNQKYSAVNKVISKNYKATSTSEDSDGKVVKKKVGLVLTNKQMAKLCEYVGVKTSKKYGKTSPLYKKLKSLGVKGFSKGGVVDVDDINKQVKANGDTTLISAKKGERILTPEQNKAFEKLVDTSLKNTSITSNLNVPNMANLIKSVPNNIDYGGFTFNFEVLANNPEDLVREVQTNLKYKEALKLATVGQLNGAGRLSVNRIK